jgi:hypothetical protein
MGTDRQHYGIVSRRGGGHIPICRSDSTSTLTRFLLIADSSDLYGSIDFLQRVAACCLRHAWSYRHSFLIPSFQVRSQQSRSRIDSAQVSKRGTR